MFLYLPSWFHSVFLKFPSISLSLSLQMLVMFLYLPCWFHSVFLWLSVYFSEPQPSVFGYVSVPTLLISLCLSLTPSISLSLSLQLLVMFLYLPCWFHSVFLWLSVYFSEPQPSVFGYVSVPTLLISLCVFFTFRLFLWASAFSFWLCFYTYLADFTLCFFNFPSISLSLSLQLLVMFLYLPCWFHSVFL